MKYAIIALYLIIGFAISYKAFKDEMKEIPNIPRSGTYKMGAELSAYFGLVLFTFIWPLLLYPMYLDWKDSK